MFNYIILIIYIVLDIIIVNSFVWDYNIVNPRVKFVLTITRYGYISGISIGSRNNRNQNELIGDDWNEQKNNKLHIILLKYAAQENRTRGVTAVLLNWNTHYDW